MPNIITQKSIIITTVLSVLLVGLVALGAEFDSSAIENFFGDAAKNQIAQAGFFFTAAAWIHSGRVKKEIKENFKSLTLAINQVAEAFKEDLKRHGDRLDNLSYRVTHLEENNNKRG